MSQTTKRSPSKTEVNSEYKAAVKVTSFFEFWPTWVMYLPVLFMWVVLAIRYRSLTLPLIANPRIYLAGMVGGSKAEVLAQAQGACASAILPWVLTIKSEEPVSEQVNKILAEASAKGIDFPLVCKPDTGCRGVGVKLVHDASSLSAILNQYPVNAGVIIQKLSSYENEVGIFYVREPQALEGNIVSLAFKARPHMMGDGRSTLEQLVLKDPRASQLRTLYAARNKTQWHEVLPKGQRHSLLFSASHCRGAIFTDGRLHITAKLNQALNNIMLDLPDFHYGRLDVKYNSLTELEAGESLEIIEINGASSEAIHIWDKDARFFGAIRMLLWQYRTLFQLGNTMRKLGEKPPSLKHILIAWHKERTLSKQYPETD